MKGWIIGAAALAGGALASTGAGPAAADSKTKTADEITCEDFLALNPSDQKFIAYWIDGYAHAKNEAALGTAAFDKSGQPLAALIEDCKATPKDTLRQKLTAADSSLIDTE